LLIHGPEWKYLVSDDELLPSTYDDATVVAAIHEEPNAGGMRMASEYFSSWLRLTKPGS
jgi:hypothetical protein